jgi:hypothetical protein
VAIIESYFGVVTIDELDFNDPHALLRGYGISLKPAATGVYETNMTVSS